jgi:signal transduction histidine kinase
VSDTARAFNTMAEQLETQDQARRHLMADIAHELRTPLAIVQGKIEGLIDGVYPRDNDQLQGVLEDTRVLARLVEDLRTLATAESGALALSKEPTDLAALAHDAVSSLAVAAADAGIDLRVESDATAAGDTVDVDPIRIREVLVNLLTNALRHTPRGGRVDVRVVTRSRELEVTVADTGSGIDASVLPHIFDRFYKGAGSSGSGLGLAIARNLVQAHGGSIRAESRVGEGTQIVVVLPR